ncbi:MAG: metallophosphoesterase, partial [Flavobacteriaceae bacterium]|nr:metallophosphoesterase [Flavobacteriaceae bacterium]
PKDKKKNLELIQHFYKKIGFRLLMNESDIHQFNEVTLAIIGVENWGLPPFKKYGNLKKAMATTDHADFKILLSHDPSHWEEEVLKHTDIDLTLSGHTHGMQAGINFKNKMWSPIKFKYKYWLGLYQIDRQYLYVNRGLGWLGFPGRMGMRPEITCVELKNS